ncbi:polysaccharide pyruvyl transferase family protein [Vibrio maerlii]|uniref:polysaccharide pyruvyl transferase family protein n=1 Tax=Vibrio maerlii TaxID=2231648 RepID=UPI000E3BC5EC|nr:polysaccharide pyruvyl transferase family protein [Vibrio maerlii]
MTLDGMIARLGLNKYIPSGQKMPHVICRFDTGISSLNLGDEIINGSAETQLRKVFSSEQFFDVSSHNGVSGKSIYFANNCRLRLVCGSNLLRRNLLRSGNWDISPLDIARLTPLTLMGVGWFRYSSTPDFLTQALYRQLFSSRYTHSVRDEYTKVKLEQCGVKEVLNTGCPTIWPLNPEHCQSIPRLIAENVVFTLTDYSPNIERDQALIDVLKSTYKDIYFWPQGSGDLLYLNQLSTSGISILPASLESYDDLLVSDIEVDFVGTRLHAGIRALQHRRRAKIVAIDNRAIEKHKDFNIPIILPNQIGREMQAGLQEPITTDIRLPQKEIDLWLGQF